MKMRRRTKMSRRHSKRNFKRGTRVHKRNLRLGPMRGGIRA
jgi:hypothetical protein